jgi:hypothetical protein
MVHTVNFSESFEGELTELAHDVRERSNTNEGAPLPEREVVRQSIAALAARPVDPAPVPAPEPDVHKSVSELPDYLDSADVPQTERDEVETLVHLALQHGFMKAIHVAKRSSPAVEDAFHDALVDKLLPELKKRGLFS